MCIPLCTTVVHNTAQSSSDNIPPFTVGERCVVFGKSELPAGIYFAVILLISTDQDEILSFSLGMEEPTHLLVNFLLNVTYCCDGCSCCCSIGYWMFSMAEKLVKSYRLSHKLSQSSIDALFPSSITLLPPDISRQIELDSQKAPAAGDDKYAVLCLGKRHTHV